MKFGIFERPNDVRLHHEIINPTPDPILLTSPRDVISFASGLAESSQEIIGWIGLDTQKQLVGCGEIFRGTLDSCTAALRDIFTAALVTPRTHSIILLHCHPSSGNPQPSDEDWSFFDRATNTGVSLGIPVIDCVIIGHTSGWSRSEGGTMRLEQASTSGVGRALAHGV